MFSSLGCLDSESYGVTGIDFLEMIVGGVLLGVFSFLGCLDNEA